METQEMKHVLEQGENQIKGDRSYLVEEESSARGTGKTC